MEKILLLEKFLADQSAQLPVLAFMLDLLAAALLSLVLRGIYITYGNGVSNRVKFGNNFVLMTTVTMIVLAIVKSSPALSLGLIGALSVVRFRSAIKEPEELTYLFLCIVLGLGIGAGMRVVSILAFSTVMLLMFVYYKMLAPKKQQQNFYVSVKGATKEKDLETLMGMLRNNCERVELVNCQQHGDQMGVAFMIKFQQNDRLFALKKDVLSQYPGAQLSYLG